MSENAYFSRPRTGRKRSASRLHPNTFIKFIKTNLYSRGAISQAKKVALRQAVQPTARVPQNLATRNRDRETNIWLLC
jgi:hypothetical protein